MNMHVRQDADDADDDEELLPRHGNHADDLEAPVRLRTAMRRTKPRGNEDSRHEKGQGRSDGLPRGQKRLSRGG